MSPSSLGPLAFLSVLLSPLLALAQQGGAEEPARSSSGNAMALFWVGVIGVIMLLWLFNVLRKRGGPPPMDPTLRGPNSSSR